nr:MAG TPA: hypothetical protein [Caudoviricetes sp.]
MSKAKEVSLRLNRLQEMSPQRINALSDQEIDETIDIINEYIEEHNKSSSEVKLTKINRYIYELRCDIDSYLAYISDPAKPIEYFSILRKITQRKGLPSNAIYQALVWRKESGNPTIRAGQIMRDIILPKYKCVVSDQYQTLKGERMWDTFVEIMLDKGYKVRIINFTSGNYFEVKDFEEYIDLKDEFYGKDSWFSQYRICIYK